MLDREVIRLEGNETGTKVESAEINRELKRMQQGYESEKQFYDSMQSQLGMSEQEIKDDVSNKLLLEKLATASIHITDTQVDTYINEHMRTNLSRKQSTTFSKLLFPPKIRRRK